MTENVTGSSSGPGVKAGGSKSDESTGRGVRNRGGRAPGAETRRPGYKSEMYPGGNGEPWRASEQDQLPIPRKFNLKAMSPNRAQTAQEEVQGCLERVRGAGFSTE